jgi:hypothetical protein
MASKKASKSRQRQSISDLSPRERQAKGVRGGRVAVSTTETAVRAKKAASSEVPARRLL